VSIGDVEAQAHTLPGVGLAVLASGGVAGAGARFAESAPLAQSVGEAGDWMDSLIQVWLGTVAMLQGDLAAAVAPVERGLASARRRGDRLTIYVALFNLSQLANAQGDHARARACLEEGIQLSPPRSSAIIVAAHGSVPRQADGGCSTTIISSPFVVRCGTRDRRVGDGRGVPRGRSRP